MFRKSKQNRRKPSRREKRLERRQALGQVLRKIGIVLSFVAVAAGLPALIFVGYDHLMESEYFALTYVDVEGLNYLEEEALLDAAEAVAGEHILDVHPEELESTMAGLPFVKTVDVERQFPDRLHISIVEYEPAAIVVDQGFWLADEAGHVFLALDATAGDSELWQLPLVSGLSRADLVDEQGRHKLVTGLEVYELYHRRGLAEQYPVSEVHIDDVLGLSLMVGETGTEVRLGWGRWEERLDRLEVVQNSLVRRGVDATYVLIDHESDLSRVTVGRRAEPGIGEAAAP